MGIGRMGLNIVTIVGARPQFIKAAPVSAVLRKDHREYLVHTGQHYDRNMSALFFEEMQIPEPDLNLEIGSGPHGEQTGRMLVGVEEVLEMKKPDLVIVYGDTNSTLAGALAAAKLNIPVAHVEAGLRSFNRLMPEEINRVLADRIAQILLCPTRTAVEHLRNEGIVDGVYLPGDVMYDAALHFARLADGKTETLKKLKVSPKSYILATCHRPQNTDYEDVLGQIVEAFIESGEKIIFPVHPRTRGFLIKFNLMEKITANGGVELIEPVGYLDMIQLEKNAKKIVTDSGGVQKEAYFYKIPCITMRPETEWVETVEDGWNKLVGSDKKRILNAILSFSPDHAQGSHYGDGRASKKIVGIINQFMKNS